MKLFENLDQRYRFVRRSRQILFACVDCVGEAVLRAFRRKSADASPAAIEPATVRRLLVIQLDHLGDAVMTTSLLPALKRRFPQATIDLLAAPWNWEVFSASREVARIHISRHNRFHRGLAALWPAAIFYWIWKLRRERYDLAIDVRGDFLHALLMWAAGIRRRIGWSCAGGGFLLTHRAEYQPGRPEVLSRHAVLKALGVTATAADVPRLEPSPDAVRFITYMLGDFRRSDRPLLLFHIGAGTQAKTWPATHWRELLGRMILEQNARVILVGSDADRRAAREITDDMYWPGVMDWTGRLKIEQLAALAQRASLFVGGDSGPAHLAAAAGAKVLALFSGTNNSQQWRPWGDRVAVLQQATPCAPCYLSQCRFREHPCLRELTPDRVAEQIHASLWSTSSVPSPHILSLEEHRARRGKSA